MEKKETLHRRDFLVRSLKVGAAVGVTGFLGWRFHDPEGPPGAQQEEDEVSLPDFSVPGMDRRLAVVRGEDRAATLELALHALGGMSAFVKEGDRVLVKVNAAFASPPILSATTHPALVERLVQLCFKAGAGEVIVTDNPINDPQSCFVLSGIEEAARRAGGRVIYPRSDLFQPTTLPGGRLIRSWPLLYGPFHGVNKLIGVAPVKDHHRSGASMIMKNWYGLLGGRRNVFHQDVHTIITELAMMVKPTLAILDGTTTMMTNGPTGGSLADLKATHTLIAGTDQVSVDAFGATLLDKTVLDLPFIHMAESAGVGTSRYETLNPTHLQVS